MKKAKENLSTLESTVIYFSLWRRWLYVYFLNSSLDIVAKRYPWSVLHSARSSGPAALWIAPSTPPPPRRELFAAFTIACTSVTFVMSPFIVLIKYIVYYSFSISSSIPYIFLNASRSAWFLISITSSILPVWISLKPATYSPLHMLALIIGFLFFLSYVFVTVFLLNSPTLSTFFCITIRRLLWCWLFSPLFLFK